MSLLKQVLTFFHRVEELSDRMWEQINQQINQGEKCKFCHQILSFPMAILSCGHLYDAKCLEDNWQQPDCPECHQLINLFDRVQSDQQVAEIKWNPVHREQDDLKGLSNQTSCHSLEELLSNEPLPRPTPTELVQTRSADLPTPTATAKASATAKAVSLSSRLPTRREPSPQITSPRVVRDKHHTNNPLHLLSDADRHIWKLVQNYRSIPDSHKLFESGHFYNTTFRFISSYIPIELYQAAKQLQADNLTQLIEKNPDLGNCLMYAMMLFLGLEYYTRDKHQDLDVKRKFRQLFNYQLFQFWRGSAPSPLTP